MEAIRLFKLLNRDQRNTFLACFLGWSLDALDFFLLTFVLVPISREFGRSIPEVAFAITLAINGATARRVPVWPLRRQIRPAIPLMIDIIFYLLMELLTAFAPNFTVLLLLRVLFGIGMGGEWGLGASLAMESLPTANTRSVLGNLAAGLCRRLSACGVGLSDWVSTLWLARIVYCRRIAGFARDLHSGARPGITSVAAR